MNANPNTVETLRGHPLAERVLARQAELEIALNKVGGDTAEGAAIELALASLPQLLTGDLDHPSDATAHDLNNWLERNKYLGLSAKLAMRKKTRRKAKKPTTH